MRHLHVHCGNLHVAGHGENDASNGNEFSRLEVNGTYEM
jgi:hypothetical protein